MFISSDDIDEVWDTVAGVKIWRFALDRDADSVRMMRAKLSGEELERADRFVISQLRARFIVARATLRTVLARMTYTTDPCDIEFVYGSHGKPAIGGGLKFNISHSQGIALLAVSESREIGIDIEAVDLQVEIEQIAARFFTPEECRDITSRPASERYGRFFDLWCCKEAYLKAVGTGISGGLDRCSIVEMQDGSTRVANPDVQVEFDRWQVYRLSPADGYSGAICVERAAGSPLQSG